MYAYLFLLVSGCSLAATAYASEVESASSLHRSKELPIDFQTQQNNYYGGPASASMIVNALGYNYSQEQMADLLQTDQAGTIAGANVTNALNKVVAGSNYKFRWTWHHFKQVETMKQQITEAIDHGNAVMVNTVEGPGDWYIRGHNLGYRFYHYGVVADYFDYGNTVTYVDPGYGRFSGFEMQQRVTIEELSYAAGERGYAW